MHSGDKTVRWEGWEAKHLEDKQLWLARAKNLDSWPRGLGTRREVKGLAGTRREIKRVGDQEGMSRDQERSYDRGLA